MGNFQLPYEFSERNESIHITSDFVEISLLDDDGDYPGHTNTTRMGEREPSSSDWMFFFGTWLNILLVFIPLSFISHYLGWDARLIFILSFLAIMPLAKLLANATKQLQISVNFGKTLPPLLNRTFGHAPEIMVGITILIKGELRIVQMFILGSILFNLLPALCISVLADHSGSRLRRTNAKAYASLMILSCITLVIPAVYANLTNARLSDLLSLSRNPSIFVLICYCFFQLITMNEDEQGSDSEQKEPRISAATAGVVMLLATAMAVFCAIHLIDSIEETVNRYHVPQAFIGAIVLPFVGNAAEHVTSVWMIMKGKQDLGPTIDFCIERSMHAACFMMPLFVIVGWIINQPLTLRFSNFGTIVVVVSVLRVLVTHLIMDGITNYMEGIMPVTRLYLVATGVSRSISLLFDDDSTTVRDMIRLIHPQTRIPCF